MQQAFAWKSCNLPCYRCDKLINLSNNCREPRSSSFVYLLHVSSTGMGSPDNMAAKAGKLKRSR